ncbi:uncharacterized protein LOC18773112 [Prunus persica]|uniref:uncharacterized protein LOC18773112 n=1 Tax=Prunus persica TaxID=3760 RepID=UPI0009AB52A2|nr:uncharacterized protein LOC18773112 [Prunus persica]XP_020420559.1 uncharacterized protein LOC18773112 [Prunus persica]
MWTYECHLHNRCCRFEGRYFRQAYALPFSNPGSLQGEASVMDALKKRSHEVPASDNFDDPLRKHVQIDHSTQSLPLDSELENPLIIIHEKKISSINDVVKVLELVLQL